jgi:ATP-dependent DNA helicase PIF1
MTQDEAFEILKTGNNVFITGSAGSGKTHLINRYIAFLREHKVDVAVTASTGIAATHMGGVTIHSWSGLGIRDGLSEWDLEILESKAYLWKRFENVKVLIIDEVSMMHHFRLDMVDRIIRHFRRNTKPFGGIQVVLVGDFFQLPPISRAGEPDAHFIFKSEAWKDSDFTVCYLTTQFRQTDDAFLTVLNAIRANDVDEEAREHLRKRYKKKPEVDIEPTRLFTHNADVDNVNEKELDKINGDATEYEMTGKGSKNHVELLKKHCLAPDTLRLKVGAKVMCVKNNPEGRYVNGTLGVVVSCEKWEDPVIRVANGSELKIGRVDWQIADEDGKVKSSINQYPLRLAWAITVHKSQGMSLDAVEVDLSKSFEKGMGYVALSRVRSLAGLSILGINETAFQVNDEVLEYDAELRELSKIARKALKETAPESLKRKQDAFIASISDVKVKTKSKKRSTYDITKDFILTQVPLDQIAKDRDMTKETIVSHIEKIIEEDTTLDVSYLLAHLSQKKLQKIREAIEKVHKESDKVLLTPVKEIVGDDATYLDIRLVRLVMEKENLL